MTSRVSRRSLTLLATACLAIAASALVQTSSAAAVDPDKAAVVAVDRFSPKAGHLQVRTDANGLPAANAPVDFDNGPFVTQGLSPEGKPVRYYNFDVQPTTPGIVYVFYRKGETAPLAGQLPIIDTLPGQTGYNDFRQVWKAIVPAGYEVNSITDAAALRKSGFALEKTDALRNMPVVSDGSVASHRLGNAPAGLQRAWIDGKVAKYFAFDETRLVAANGEDVPVSAIYVFFNVNPDKPNGGPASGFRKEAGSAQTHNVVSTLPGNPAYSPLWLVSVYDTADWPMVKDIDTASKANVLGVGVATVNCPVFFVTP